MTTTFGQLFIVGLTSLNRLEIQFVPMNLKISSKGNFQDIAVVGRNTPKYQYTGGSEELKLDLDFHAVEELKDDVVRKVNWLKALRYSGGFGVPPEKVKLIWGDLFSEEEWIVKAVEVEYKLFDIESGMLPKQAYVNLTLCLDPKFNWTASNVRRSLSLNRIV